MTKVNRRKAVVTLLGSAGCLVGIPITIRLLPAFSEECKWPTYPYQPVDLDRELLQRPKEVERLGQVTWAEGLSFLERPLPVEIEEDVAMDCCTFFGRTRQ